MLRRKQEYYKMQGGNTIYSDAFLGHSKPEKMLIGNKLYGNNMKNRNKKLILM